MNQVVSFVQQHWAAILAVLLLMFKTAVNAFPAQGEPFQFGQWFMEWMRELAQQAPLKLSTQQSAVLKNAGMPVK
jgi:hypothetical protein